MNPRNTVSQPRYCGKTNMCENSGTVIVVTSGADLATPDFLPGYIKILLGAFPGEIYVITSRVPFSSEESFNERVHIKQIMPETENGKGKGIVTRIIRYLLTQLKVSYVLVKERKADAYIFFLAQSLVLPILILKLMRRKVILAVGASFSKLVESRKDRLLLFPRIEEKISYKVSDQIVIYSENIVGQFNLEKYKGKISIARRHFLDFDKFKMQKQLSERDNLVGYIGRLSEEKGILNFVEAIPKVLEVREDIGFLIGGDGQLRGKVEKYLDEENLIGEVKLPGWIPRDELPKCLNELKLLVLPSYTEGLPNIMLEAMACGTPVLATPVGAIPDVIKDGESGFIMEDNSPECIARNVIRVLNHSNLEETTYNARALVEREFTCEAAVRAYKHIFDSLEKPRL